ncbi:MAG: abortive infection family protein [Hydrogenophaga sp.]|jgi:hypothetical protein|nr:abortive infection family protein [Hydrogenophaga sp.]
MQKLRDTLALYSHWRELEPYVERIEAHMESDFSLSVENAKALLESVGKQVCKARGAELGSNPSINAVLKRAFIALDYPAEGLAVQVSGALATIGQQIGDLRNQISPTSHGKPLDELKERNSKVDLMTRDFLVDSTVAVAVLLIRAFEERQPTQPQPAAAPAPAAAPDYGAHQDFNEYWDGAFGDFAMGAYVYCASEVLFKMDAKAYLAECDEFESSQQDTPPGEAL